MDLQHFLQYILTSAGAGLLDAGIIAFLVQITHDSLPAPVRFYGAVALGFGLPALALWLQVLFGWAQWTPDAIFAVLSVGYVVSQTIHWEVAGKVAAALARMATRQIRADQDRRIAGL